MTAQIFGRDAELRTIGAFLDRLPHSSGAQVLAGPAGAGKTTLLRAGVALACERGLTVLQTMPARSDGRLAFAGLADLLEPNLGAVIDEMPAPQARALRMALLLQEAPANPPEPRLIAAAFRTAVGLLARSGPVLAVIDDVQWLDPPSETAVGFAIRRLEQQPVGLLCAQRTERPGEQLPLELGQARFRADLLPVGGLSAGALHRMLRTRLGTSFSHPTLRRIEAGSGGNPFVALEIGRALARRGLTAAGSGPLPVPATLAGLVTEHLGDLLPDALDAVRLVAVMPDAAIEEYLAAGAASAGLDAAVRAGVLEMDGSVLRFSHPLLAAAVTGAIPPGRGRELHAVAAAHARQPEEQARHRALAADGPSALVAAELDEAAMAAAGRGAPATAAELSGLAAALTPPDHADDFLRRRLAAARQLTLAGDTRAARSLLAQLVTSMPAGPARADALSQLGWLQEDDFAAATTLLEQALAEAGDDPARTAEIHFYLYEIWVTRGDQARAVAAARQALADAERAGDAALLASCLAQACLADLLSGTDLDRRMLDRAIELERFVGGLPLRTSPSEVAGVWHFVQGRLEEAEEAQQRALARAESDGLEYWRADMLLALSQTALRRGDARRAAALAADGLQIAEQLGLPHPTITLLYGSASAALLLGQADMVRELAGRGMELARSAGDLPFSLAHQALLGSLELARGDYQAAASWLRPLAPQLLELGLHPTTQIIAPEVAEALIAIGELDEAASFLQKIEGRMRGPVTAALAARCTGALAAASGDLGAAVTALIGALRLLGQVSSQPLERGRTLLLLGAVQRRLQQRRAARETLSEAIGTFDEIGAVLWAARGRAELARISGRAAEPDNLTATELRVAELVARGLRNKQMAAELSVSVRAVESTLTRVYAKLSIRSRTELAAHLHRGA